MKSHHHGVALEPIRRYLAELGYAVDPLDFIERPEQRLSTLCYLLVDEHLLMLRRRKEPFSNHWTAPGGKIEDGENPAEAIVREVREETNLTVHQPELKAICSEIGADEYNWLLFIFACRSYEGELVASDEGELRWLPLAQIDQWPLPDIDRHILRYVLDDEPTPYAMRVVYTPDHRVASFDVRSLRG